ncbi:MAG: energy transducer TonB, partial [Flavobacteriaceae bacterium]|nr:energy transducer TonB [Flavobacteriaceae bacterium]
PPPAPAPEVIEVIEDDDDIEETIIESAEVNQEEEIVEIDDIEEADEEISDVPFSVIENVPIYPGCEKKKNNAEKKKCMSEKVMKFVQKKFNTDLAGDLGLEGRQRISVQFKIDKNGNVVNVRARAPHPKLEQEAVKVVNALPKMIPGKQRGKAVGVLYSLPILFQVEN